MKTSRSRRDFLRLSTAGALGAIVVTQAGCKTPAAAPAGAAEAVATPADMRKFGVGIQLYTIRDAMATDPVASLKKLSNMGYKNLELASYADGKFYDMEPEEFKKVVNDLGMDATSSHSQVEALGVTLDNAKKMADDHVKLGVKYCVQPWVVEEDRKTIASFQKLVENWNKVGQIMKDRGIQFGYHNHNFEFATVEGKIPYFDVYMKEMDKDLITMEMDLFWVIKAGQNPVDIFNKYPGRFQLLHLKDMYTKEDPFYIPKSVDMAPVGAGVIDFKQILAAKDVAGVKYTFVEQDCQFEGPGMSIKNLTTKILV